jgi:hypothetical protein
MPSYASVDQGKLDNFTYDGRRRKISMAFSINDKTFSGDYRVITKEENADAKMTLRLGKKSGDDAVNMIEYQEGSAVHAGLIDYMQQKTFNTFVNNMYSKYKDKTVVTLFVKKLAV